MATASETTSLSATRREAAGSRSARRLRRSGRVPGVVYGGDEAPLPFAVDARELRHVLGHAGAVISFELDGGRGTPVVLKELDRHPVSGETVHLDLLRVRLDETIQTTVVLELTGVDEAPGVKEGGVLEQITRELNIEALPQDIPDAVEHDASGLVAGDTLTLSAVAAPRGVRLLDDPETVVASITAPRLQLEDDNEIEAETELIGDGATEADEAAPEGEPDTPPETTSE